MLLYITATEKPLYKYRNAVEKSQDKNRTITGENP